MRLTAPTFLLCACVMAVPLRAAAQDVNDKVRAFVASDLRGWAEDPAIVAAIQAGNAAHSDLTPEAIEALDQTWRAETAQTDRPTIQAVLDTPASQALREHVTGSDGFVTEAFVVDQTGLNVAASSVTSDYWQGDEAKFTKTYPEGADAVFIDEVEFDESTQSYQVQVSFTITDPTSHAPIGAMTVGLDAEAFE
ncbi:hypothetical protein DL1_13705 [Thioclava dalianensis]|uniref:Uncharacterized protein n=1 Tax=Thioclava dalianensis TaxID=1185766 RepID=A0A074TL20_9RHOB|nr:hypothetical protein [Thioclava dalianensis]KEP70865.1 hypothetical protein DL1_13705 [Thioclava dalianensis]SFN12700.1 hypothetical protein SAMN05216224_102532 [Thioclava dalianensis]